MNRNFTKEAKHALENAVRAAVYHRQNYAGTEHILVGLIKETEGTASNVLMEAGVQLEKLENLIDRLIAPQGGTVVMDRPGMSPRAETLFREAEHLSNRMGMQEIGTEHLLLAMLSDRECVGTRLLHTMGIDLSKLQADTIAAMNADGSLNDDTVLALK